MSGPWPQIIICTNFSSPTAPTLIRAYFRQHRQPTLLHLWLSFSQTREILRQGAKTRDNESCERVNGAGAPRGEGGCYVRSNVVRSSAGEGETVYNAQTRDDGRVTNLMGGQQTLSSSGDAQHLPGKQSTIPAPGLTFCSFILLSAPLPPPRAKVPYREL